jgi:hypothetical protein
MKKEVVMLLEREIFRILATLPLEREDTLPPAQLDFTREP